MGFMPEACARANEIIDDQSCAFILHYVFALHALKLFSRYKQALIDAAARLYVL